MSIDGGEPLVAAPGAIEREVFAKLANPPKGKLGNQSIRSVIVAGEATGNEDSLFGDFLRHDLNRARKAGVHWVHVLWARSCPFSFLLCAKARLVDLM